MPDIDVQHAEVTPIPWWIRIAVVGLLAISAYALRVTLHNHADFLTLELTGGEVTRRPTIFSKIRREDQKQYLWAKGPKTPSDDRSEWFDMTGSPITLERVNHGIGRDTIPAIAEPRFVRPDDPRFVARWNLSGREDVGMMQVIGVEIGGIAKAYPVSTLNRHELVNDEFAGLPVTVGW